MKCLIIVNKLHRNSNKGVCLPFRAAFDKLLLRMRQLVLHQEDALVRSAQLLSQCRHLCLARLNIVTAAAGFSSLLEQ